MSLNFIVCRLGFGPFRSRTHQQPVRMVDMLPLLEAEAKERQAHGMTAPGQTLTEKIPEALKGESRQKAADSVPEFFPEPLKGEAQQS